MTEASIYQRLYDADMGKSGSGILAILANEPRDENVGYIVVNESLKESGSSKLFSEVVIPEGKKYSYTLAQRLFDNYETSNIAREDYTDKELTEIDQLLRFAVTRPVMKIAQKHVSKILEMHICDEKWIQMVYDKWFRFFKLMDSPTHSGFEHVFLGEEEESTSRIGGFHWWYYFVHNATRVAYKRAMYSSKSKREGVVTPEIVTMTFSWKVDEDTVIEKPRGGMLVGVSVEGILAMGMVRAFDEGAGVAVINGMEIDMRLYKSDDDLSIITFYPILQRLLVAKTPEPAGVITNCEPAEHEIKKVEGPLRMVAIVPNPVGHDTGREKLTLMNVFGTSEEAVSLLGWKVISSNKSSVSFGDVELEHGGTRTFTMAARGSLAMSNKGGTLSLLDASGGLVQKASYERSDARVQGGVLFWDGADKFVMQHESETT